MRISSAYAFESSLANLQRRQSQLSDSQEQLTSGKRVRRASDDPASAAAAERALAAQSRAEAHLRALGASRNAMQLTETALGNAGDLVQQARESLVSAGNGTYSDSDRATLAASLEQMAKRELPGIDLDPVTTGGHRGCRGRAEGRDDGLDVGVLHRLGNLTGVDLGNA